MRAKKNERRKDFCFEWMRTSRAAERERERERCINFCSLNSLANRWVTKSSLLFGLFTQKNRKPNSISFFFLLRDYPILFLLPFHMVWLFFVPYNSSLFHFRSLSHLPSNSHKYSCMISLPFSFMVLGTLLLYFILSLLISYVWIVFLFFALTFSIFSVFFNLL